jgi:PAS domain-containing protein
MLNDETLLRTIFDAMPALVFVVDQDVRIQEYNTAAADFLKLSESSVIRHRGGEALHCIHSTESPDGCGHADFCKNCVIRNSVNEAFSGSRIVRRRTKLELVRNGNITEIYALITASIFMYNDMQLVILSIEDINELAELRKMIPICSVCKRVHDDKNAWLRIESYLKEHWDIEFSHGLCPECYKKEIKKINKL